MLPQSGISIINVDTYKLEKEQRRAARWIQSEYSRTTSVDCDMIAIFPRNFHLRTMLTLVSFSLQIIFL